MFSDCRSPNMTADTAAFHLLISNSNTLSFAGLSFIFVNETENWELCMAA